MSSKPVRIAQISDLHIKPPGSLAYGRVDTAKALERCVATLNEFKPAPDFVVISGDLADTPLAAEYDYLKSLLTPLKLPFAGIPGNHDSCELMRAAFPLAGDASPSGPLNQKIELDGLDLVLLDSSVPGKPHGELDSSTLQWLDATLTMFAGVPATICPAPNHAVDLDLEHLREPSFKVEPPAFHLHSWFPGDGFGSVVTHQVPIGTFDGPHPFFGPDGKLL